MSVTARGGYQTVDLSKYVFLVKTPVSCPDVIEQIANCKNKPTIVANLKYYYDGHPDEVSIETCNFATFESGTGTIVGLTITRNLFQIALSCNLVEKTITISTYTINGSEDE